MASIEEPRPDGERPDGERTAGVAGAAEAERRYFEGMSAQRKKVIAPLVVLVCVVYFVLPVLTNFTSLLDGIPFGGLSWAYLYAFAIFILVLVITMFYQRRMDAAEQELRPRNAAEVAADYEHWDEGEN